MITLSSRVRTGLSFFTLALSLTVGLRLPAAVINPDRQPLISAKIDESQITRLGGNVRAEATANHDRGAVSDSMQFNHLQLALRRSPAVEAALEAYMESSQTPGSTNYHQWLTAAQLGKLYGPHPADIATLKSWLGAHGFQVNNVSASGMLIDFSGTAAQVTETFKTEIHNLDVSGQKHFANMQNPAVPEALSNVVAGLISLNDFRPHPLVSKMHKGTAMNPTNTEAHPAYTVNSDYQLVVPADLQTIYNFKPLYKSGITGTGQTVILLERTDLYSNDDYYAFRKAFGLDSFKNGSFKVVHPGGCNDPGDLVGDDGEAAVDVEWAAAAAPDAKIVLASCADTETNFGPFNALQALVDASIPPAIVSLSYGGCETDQGAAGNHYVKLLYQQAAAEGISVFVAAGDWAAATCDAGYSDAEYGISVNGLASTPYNLAAGGTDYSDTYSGTTSQYWREKNTSTYGSAKSYIPEMPWDNSCANLPLTHYEGYKVPYGTSGFCNSAVGSTYFTEVVAGGGGPSGCAYGETNPNPNTPAVSGTCKGYAKPIWQQFIAGMPNDGVRDLPDVSLFAANGLWGHYYSYCYSNPYPNAGGAPCTGSPANWAGAGGTSFVAPILAGVQALINQKAGERQGNPDYIYYLIATLEYGANGNSSCASNNGGNSCVFHDITLGDITVNCKGPFNCYDPSGPNGVLSVTSDKYSQAYAAHTGWDFASGIGSLNVTKLVKIWADIAKLY